MKAKARPFDVKTKVEKVYKLPFEELVSTVLEPHARSGDKVKVWFVDGKIIFYSALHCSAVQRRTMVDRTLVELAFCAEMSEYKNYIVVGLNGEIKLLDSLEGLSGEVIVIPVVAHGEANPWIPAILEKLEKVKT